MPDWILAILTAAAVTTFLVWFLHLWILRRHARDLERYKRELEFSFGTELEAYKSKLLVENTAFVERMTMALQVSASEVQSRFARLHEKVAEVVAELYARLSDQVLAFERYVSNWEPGSGPTKKKQRENLSEAMVKFMDFFRLHHLYVSKDLADRLKAFETRLFEFAQEFKAGVEDREYDKEHNRLVVNKVLTAVKEEGRPLFEALEAQFRKMLN